MRRPPRGGGRSDIADRLRLAQRRWLERVQEHTRGPGRPDGLTLSTIARQAGLSQSTLTRFANATAYGGVLSSLSIRQIAEATGYPATADALGEPAPRAGAAPPSPRGDEIEPWLGDDSATAADPIAALLAADPGVRALTVRADMLALAGVLPGDVVVVDAAAAARDGDVVEACIEDGRGARAVLRIYRAPMLLLTATAARDAPRPELVDGERVRIAGVVTGLVRRRT